MPDAVDEMGGGTREMVLDVTFRFRCRNSGGRIYNITGFTFRRQARKVLGSYGLGFHGYFCCVEKRLTGYRRNWKKFRGRSSKYGNSC